MCATKVPDAPRLAARCVREPGRLPSCYEPTGMNPAGEVPVRLLDRTRPWTPSHRFTSEPPPRASACEQSALRPAPLRSICLAAPRASRRGDASDRLLPSHVFVRAPAPRWFPSASRAHARARFGGSPVITSGRFASAGRTSLPCGFIAVGVVFPSRCVSAEPLTPLSLLPDRARRSRGDAPSWKPPRPTVGAPRDAGARGGTARGAFHRSRALAPRRPFGRPARASFRGCGLAAARTGGRCLFTRAVAVPKDDARPSQAPVHAPRCQTGITLLWASASLADFCNQSRRAGTPDERSILAREWSFWLRCSPAPTDAGCVGRRAASPHRGACEPRSARDGFRTPRSTCVDMADRGPKRSSEGVRARLRRELRVPSS
jgi:hypothetical protein